MNENERRINRERLRQLEEDSQLRERVQERLEQLSPARAQLNSLLSIKQPPFAVEE